MNRLRNINVVRLARQYPFIFALLVLLVAILVNASLQDNFFEPRAINRNLRTFLPLIILVAGQTIVIIGGGLDLSVGAMVSMVNAILVTLIMPESSNDQILFALVIAAGAGMLAGVFNGLCVTYFRLQPLITTYATSFVYAGIALLILPRPGGQVPRHMTDFYRSTPAEIPLSVFLIVVLILFWIALRMTRYGQFLYATGGKDEAAYATGVPVNTIRFSTYVWSGLFAALAALALTLNTGSGNPRVGDAMTLDSIVAVVLGGTRLSGGQGGVIGSIIGVAILGTIRNIISFANVDTWSQTLVDALIIIGALAGPGLIRLVRRWWKER